MRHVSRFRWAVLVIGLGLATATSATGDKPLSEEEICKQTCRSSVCVFAQHANNTMSSGTGAFLDSTDPLVITNHHVVTDREKVTVMFPLYGRGGELIRGRQEYFRHFHDREYGLRGEVIATDPVRDLALVKLLSTPRVPGLKLAERSAAKSDAVHLIGNPGYSKDLWVTTPGTITKLANWCFIRPTRHTVVGQLMDVKTRERIGPGFSGGPVVNGQCELVGVIHGGRPDGGVASCIDIAEVKQFIDEARRLGLMHAGSAAAHKQAAAYHIGQARYDQAIGHLDWAVAYNERDPEAYILRGNARAGKREYERAIQDYDSALKVSQGNDAWRAKAYNQRGEIRRLEGNLDKAFADFTQAVETDPRLGDARYNRSIVHRLQGQLKQAEEDYRSALKLDPRLIDHHPAIPAAQQQEASLLRSALPLCGDDASFVVTLNVKRLLTSSLVQKDRLVRLDQALTGQLLADLPLTILGIDPFRDLSRVTLSGPSLDTSSSTAWRLLLQGQFDTQRVRGVLTRIASKHNLPDPRGGMHRVYQVGPLFMALVNSTACVLSPSKNEVIDALEKGAGWRKSTWKQKELDVALRSLDERSTLGLVMLGSALAPSDSSERGAVHFDVLSGSITIGAEAQLNFGMVVRDSSAAAELEARLRKDSRTLLVSAEGVARKHGLRTAIELWKAILPVDLGKAMGVGRSGSTITLDGLITSADTRATPSGSR